MLSGRQVIYVGDAFLCLFIKENVFRLVGCNMRFEGNSPEATGGVPPPSKHRLAVDALEIVLVVVDEDLISCEYRDIPSVCKLAGAE